MAARCDTRPGGNPPPGARYLFAAHSLVAPLSRPTVGETCEPGVVARWRRLGGPCARSGRRRARSGWPTVAVPAVLALLLLAQGGCKVGASGERTSGVADAAADTPDVNASESSDDAEIPLPCPSNRGDESAACVDAGIRSCAADLLDGDGVCKPRLDRCPPEVVARVTGGCLPVGVDGCIADTPGDGLCHPAPTACGGLRPTPEGGCEHVGIPACADIFRGSDGVCRPSLAACPAGTWPVPSLGCVGVDPPAGCGTGPWGAIAEAQGSVYVNPEAPPGGTGTRDDPVATVAAAMALALDGGRVVLAAGTYDETLVFPQHARLDVVGRCASLVHLVGRDAVAGVADPVSVIIPFADGSSLRDVSVAPPGGGVVVAGTAGATLERVHIEGVAGPAVSVGQQAAQVKLDRCVIEGAGAPRLRGGGAPGNSSHPPSQGVRVLGGGAADVQRTAIVGCEGAVLATPQGGDEALATLHDVHAEDATGGGLEAATLQAQTGGRIVVSAVSLIPKSTYGVVSLGAGSSVVVSDSVITRSAAEGSAPVEGRAAGVEPYGDAQGRGPRLALERTRIEGSRGAAIVANGGGSDLALTGCLVAGSGPGATGPGEGIVISAGASARVEASALLDNTSVSVAATGPGTVVKVIDSVIAGTHAPEVVSGLGAGALATGGAILEVERTAVTANWATGLGIQGAGSALVADRVLVEGTLFEPTVDYSGSGVVAQDGAALTLRDSAVVDNHGVGVVAIHPGTTATVERTLVRGTRPSPASGRWGRGLEVGESARATLEDVVLADNTGVGLAVAGGADVTASGLHVATTAPGVADGDGGVGIQVYLGGTLQASRVALTDNHTAGAIVDGGDLLVEQAYIAGTKSGPGGAGAGDGVICQSAGRAVIGRALVEHCDRAGLLYRSSSGRVEDSLVRDNTVGIVTIGTPQPDLLPSAVPTGNPDGDRVNFGDYPTPAGFIPLPLVGQGG